MKEAIGVVSAFAHFAKAGSHRTWCEANRKSIDGNLPCFGVNMGMHCEMHCIQTRFRCMNNTVWADWVNLSLGVALRMGGEDQL